MSSNAISVLIVEDEVLIGLDLATELEEHGFAVHGPYRTAEKALAALDELSPSICVLDINLGDGKTSEPVAERLASDGTPFVFLTGYSMNGNQVLRRFSSAECLQKPVNVKNLIARLEGALG